MKNDQSLSSFFDNADKTTLDNCDREKIHFSNAIQPLGALIAVDQLSHKVVAVSENLAAFFNLESKSPINVPLSHIDTELADQVAVLQHSDSVLHEVLDFELDYKGTKYDTVTHVHAGIRLIEFLQNDNPKAIDARKSMRQCTASCGRILNAYSYEDALQIAVDAVRELAGFGRVKIYRFLPDWSGAVIAESIESDMTSFLGLHFPERDIPRQVRSIMTMIPYRAIGTSDDILVPIHSALDSEQPLDLSWSLLRSVSGMHTAYLRNMGVKASFSCSLMYKGELWGLIAAHHNQPKLIPYDKWGLIHEISATLMLRYDQHQRSEVSDMLKTLRVIENSFASSLRKNGDVEQVINTLVPVLEKLLGADGFAFQYGSKLHVSGATPPAPFIRELIQWAISKRKSSDQYQTIRLHNEWAPAKDHIDTACGVLIQPIVVHRVCQLIWFRGAISQKVDWAGAPAEKTVVENSGTLQSLTPRNSFARWTQEHNDQSAPWQESQLNSAREIFTEFLDIIAAQLLLKEENESLRDFAAIAAHDIKAPLRRIHGALDIMSEENFSGDIVKKTHAMAMNSAKRLDNLTSDLLELSIVSGQKTKLEKVDLNILLGNVTDVLSTAASEFQATINVDPLPTVVADEGLLTRLFLNLLSNSVKYRHPERTPEIHVSLIEPMEKNVCIAVSDNGIGIDSQHAEKIFDPLVRLHTQDDIEGTGLGLSICQRIVDAHEGSIELDINYTQGTRILIYLPVRTV